MGKSSAHSLMSSVMSGFQTLRWTLLCCFSASVVLASVYDIKTLNEVKDLKESVHFPKDFPHHGLMLLHWFANIVEIDEGVIQLAFDPEQGNYGLHHRRHKVPEESESRYYCLGDLSHGRSRMLPLYVTQDFHNSKESADKNMDRVLIKVHKQIPERVDRVYITQDCHGTGFMNNTFEISPQLLIQIRELGKDTACSKDDPREKLEKCELLDYLQRAAKLNGIYPKAPGLAWFLILAGYDTEQRISAFFCKTTDPDGGCVPLSADESQCFLHCRIKLKVKFTSKGYARITWSGIPESIARTEANIGLYRDGTEEEPLTVYPLKGRTFGSEDTTVPLNPGLQVRLVRKEKTEFLYFFSTINYKDIWKGPEFEETNRVLPTRVNGYDMSLQLYTKDGYACARIYIKECFTNWRTVFDNSWVGFYASSFDGNGDYKKYEWVVNFEKRLDDDFPPGYNIYEHESSLDIGPGVQARLMLTKYIASEKARTVPWEDISVFKQA